MGRWHPLKKFSSAGVCIIFMKEEWDLAGLADRLQASNPRILLISNELGCGVVPVDAFDRKYRETAGRICTEIAAKSSQVIRVVCGIGTVLKDA